MTTDLPAPDLGAIRRRLEAIGITGDWWLHDMALTRSDIAAFLATYDAQATRLAAHQAVLERLRDRAYFSSDPYSRDYAEFIDAEMATLDG